MHLKKPLIALILASALGAGVVMNSANKTAAIPTSATLLPVRMPLPELKLTDHHGAPLTADTFHGQWDLLFFGFTNCPDICPLTLQVLATSIRQLEKDGAESLPRIVLVSVDPERDTAEKLGEYIAHFGDNNLGITGELEDIRSLTSSLGIFFQKQAIDGDNYSVDHSAAVLVINPKGEFHALFGGPHNVDNFVHDLPIIMASDR